MSKILVLNTGSSSIKYQVFEEQDDLTVVCKGAITDLGGSRCTSKHEVGSQVFSNQQPIKDIKEAIETIKDFLYSKEGILNANELLKAIGHRVVHGGSKFSKPILINTKTLQELEGISYLAPLHNSINILGIKLCQRYFPKVPQLAVFDTAFHQTLPQKAFRYAISNELYSKHNIRVYGFHGTSHQYVSQKAIRYLKEQGRAHQNIIIMHLGNGCSMSAIKEGRCVDTSMGLTPLSGLVMGTRSGDIDPSVFLFLKNQKGLDIEQINTLLNKDSGLLGLTGNMDMRIIEEKAHKGDAQAILAIDIFVYRIQKYIGAYTAILNGLDALVFTAGIGENSKVIREKVCEDLSFLGISIAQQSKENNNITDITKDDNAVVRVLVIPTNEELAIATQIRRQRIDPLK